MIFQHTLDAVLRGEKTQTSRTWKPNYGHVLEKNNSLTIFSKVSGRKLYYVGQEIAIQPGRTKKGVAHRRITSLGKYDVRCFSDSDFEREAVFAEGILTAEERFYNVWCFMHDKEFWKSPERLMKGTGIQANMLLDRPVKCYTALVINFEVV